MTMFSAKFFLFCKKQEQNTYKRVINYITYQGKVFRKMVNTN